MLEEFLFIELSDGTQIIGINMYLFVLMFVLYFIVRVSLFKKEE